MSTLSALRARAGAALEERLAPLSPARRQRFALSRAIVERELAARGGARVLDAGCGDGLLALAIAARHPDWHVVGVDLRTGLLDGAAARAAARGIHNVSFERADLTRPLPCGAFDAVLAVECLEEIPDDRAAIRAMVASLAPGGLLVTHVPERSWSAVLPGSPDTWRDQVRQGYDAAQIADELRTAGLELLDVRPTFRGTVVVAQELADRLRRARLLWRALAFAPLAAAVWLERHGLTWGRGHALLALARKPT